MSEANRDEWSVYAPKLLCGAIRKNCIAPTWLSDLRISVFRPEITNVPWLYEVGVYMFQTFPLLRKSNNI